GDLDDIAITRTGGFQRQADIVHHLGRLRAQIPLADHPSLIVGRYLSRDIDRARTRSDDDVGISRIVVKSAWPEMFELAHVCASLTCMVGPKRIPLRRSRPDRSSRGCSACPKA